MKKVLMMLAFVAMVFATGCRKDNPNYDFIGEYRAAEMKFDIRLDGFELQAVTLKDVTLELKRSGKENVTGTFKYGSVRGDSYSVKGECSGNMVVLDEFAINLERDGLTLDMILNCVGTLNGKTLNLNISYGGTGSLPIGGGAILSGDLEDGVVNVSFTKQGNNNNNNNNTNHEYVDLGLPSGTLWATCNVGASSPTDYGDYFAWGETQPKDTYDWSSYKYANGNYDKLTKYCSYSSYGDNGFTDNLATLEASDDAATANWGSGWRMPTKEEWQELYYNTTVTKTTQNGVNGRLFTASNGNSIFLPAAGYRLGGSLYHVGSYGYYWSSSLDTGDPYDAWRLFFVFDSGDNGMSDYGRRNTGFAVRPVCSVSQK